MTKSTDTILNLIEQGAIITFPSGFIIGKQDNAQAIKVVIRTENQAFISVKENLPIITAQVEQVLIDKASFESIFEDNASTI